MSTSPTPSSRFPFEPHIADMPPQHQYVLKNLWNAVFDAQNAIPILKSQIDSNKSAVASVTNTVTNNSTASETIIQQIVSAYGTVNNQSGNVAYSTTMADASAFIILSDASPVAVSLTAAPVITLPWACVLVNEGVGLVTATPASGTISYSGNLAAASLPLPQYFAAFISFDGTNFWAVIVPIAAQTIAAVTSKWLNSYSAATGAFTATQPAFSDLSGQIAPSTQMPTSGVTAGSYTLSSVSVNAEGLVTAASNGPTGLSVTITTAALTIGGTNGSMTYTSGILTAQTPAT